MAKQEKQEQRAPMDDHQFAMAAREELGKGENAEAYDELLRVTGVARQREEAPEGETGPQS